MTGWWRIALLGFALAAQTVIAAEEGWSPLTLRSVGRAESDAYLREYETHLAETAYLYAVPAFLHLRQRYEFVNNFETYMHDRGNPFGQFLLVRTPASGKTTDTMPNNDTLYGAAYLDLRVGAYVLSVPEISGRYYAFNFGDAYFYNFDFVSSRTDGSNPGDYLIAGPDWKGRVPPGIRRVIRAPTNSIHIYQRIYFRDAADVKTVNAIQDRIRLQPLATFLDPAATVVPPDPQQVLRRSPKALTGPLEMLQQANDYMAWNSPPERDRALVESFANLGIGPGLTLPSDPARQAIILEGVAKAYRTMSALADQALETRNGWQIPPSYLGRRGGNASIALQAMIQLRSIGYNVVEEAVYYQAYEDQQGEPLHSHQRYTLTFLPRQIPPVRADAHGFWSVTLYDRKHFRFAENAANKYVVRASDPLFYNPDGSLTIYIQRDRPNDPAQLANWLPAPADGDEIIMLRVFQGADVVVAGQYTPPPIVRSH